MNNLDRETWDKFVFRFFHTDNSGMHCFTLNSKQEQFDRKKVGQYIFR